MAPHRESLAVLTSKAKDEWQTEHAGVSLQATKNQTNAKVDEEEQEKQKKGMPMTYQTIIGVVCGFAVGIAIREIYRARDEEVPVAVLKISGFLGILFLNSLKMIILPLISFGMITTVLNMDDLASMKRLGTRALYYYMSTTFCATAVGLIVVNVIRPGEMFSPDPNAGGNKLDDIDGTGGLVQDADPNQKTTLDTFLDLGFTVFPGNLFMALGGSGTPNVLATIVFCLIFAVCLSKQQNNQAAIDFFNCLANSFMSMITFFVKFTPIGIFSLIVKQVATQEDILSMFSSLGMFMVTVVAGLFLQASVVYPAIYFFTTGGKNPLAYYKKIAEPVATAFATSSSAAALPVTIKALESSGVDEDITRFILPLGATINMDGTAVYYPVACLFVAQQKRFPMQIGRQISMAIVAAFMSIGAAPVPSAGMANLLVIIESAGVPVGPSGGEVALLLTVDFLLDRILTAVNVMGDSIGAGICQHYKEKDAAKDGSGGGDDSYVPPGSADYSQMDVSGAGSGNL